MTLLTQEFRFPDDVEEFVINRQQSMRSSWMEDPGYYIKLDSVDGFYGADIETESHVIPHATGERFGDSFRRGKGITLSGSIEGADIGKLIEGSRYLNRMFWNLQPRRLQWVEGDTEVYYLCKVINDLSITENYQTWNPTFSWTVGLRALDPRMRKIDDDSIYYDYQDD